MRGIFSKQTIKNARHVKLPTAKGKTTAAQATSVAHHGATFLPGVVGCFLVSLFSGINSTTFIRGKAHRTGKNNFILKQEGKYHKKETED